jgi:hypothetical protein
VGRYWFSWLLPGKADIGDGHRFPLAAIMAGEHPIVRAV